MYNRLLNYQLLSFQTFSQTSRRVYASYKKDCTGVSLTILSHLSSERVTSKIHSPYWNKFVHFVENVKLPVKFWANIKLIQNCYIFVWTSGFQNPLVHTASVNEILATQLHWSSWEECEYSSNVAESLNKLPQRFQHQLVLVALSITLQIQMQRPPNEDLSLSNLQLPKLAMVTYAH